MSLQDIPMIFILAGLVIYTVLGGADFGAGLWQLAAGGGERGGASATTPTTRWRRCGRPTTSG